MDIDPLRRSCICGHYWYFNKWHYVKMIIFNRITIKCPQCGRLHEYKLIYHAVEKWNNTRIPNKKLVESKQEVWKNA